jgi:hypothetical protein
MQQSRYKHAQWVGAGFAALSLAGSLLFLFPAFIIRPFRRQFPNSLAWAMTVRQHAPLWSLFIAVAAFVAAMLLWNRVSRLRRALIVVGLCLASASAVMARVDYFEWMFHPLPSPGFDAASRSQLGESEMVMAVQLGNEARAYPVRIMAYHHILNDVVGGAPIAVTY